MRRLLALVRADLRSNFGLSVARHRLFVQKRDRWLVPVIGLSLLGVVPAVYALVAVVHEMYAVLEPFGQQAALLTLGILAGQLFVLLFGLYYVVSVFYFSRDLEFLIPLPLKPFEVIASKFTVVLVNEYLTIALIVLPVIASYGVAAGSGPAYWLTALLVYLLLPVIPLTAASVVVVALMRIVNFSRKKDALILTGSLLLLLLAMGFQFVITGPAGRQLDTEAMTRFMTSPDSLLNAVGSRFPPSIWASKAIAGGFSGPALANLALFTGTSLALFVVLLVVSEKVFYRGLVGLSEVAGRRHVLSGAEMAARVSSGRHPVWAIFVREWRLMNRTPVFLLNGTLGVLIVPALFVMMSRAGSDDISAMLRLMQSANTLLVVLSIAAFMVVCGSVNGTASSTFSREGAQFWISRVIPVAAREQVAAKFLHAYLVSLLGAVAALVVVVWLLRPAFAQLVAAVGLAQLVSVLLTAVGMAIDLARPLLDWTNPQKAIKQNLNVLLALLADVAILTGLYFAIRLMVNARLPDPMVLALLFAVLTALSAMGYAGLVKFAERRYREMDS